MLVKLMIAWLWDVWGREEKKRRRRRGIKTIKPPAVRESSQSASGPYMKARALQSPIQFNFSPRLNSASSFFPLRPNYSYLCANSFHFRCTLNAAALTFLWSKPAIGRSGKKSDDSSASPDGGCRRRMQERADMRRENVSEIVKIFSDIFPPVTPGLFTSDD